MENNHRLGKEKFLRRAVSFLGGKRLFRCYRRLVRYQGPTPQRREHNRMHYCFNLVPLVMKLSHTDSAAKKYLVSFMQITSEKHEMFLKCRNFYLRVIRI